MKYKGLVLITLIYFLLINTSYYWESILGVLAMLTTLVLGLGYLILFFIFLKHLILSFNKENVDKDRLIVAILLGTVLITTFFKPHGLINFDKLEGKDLLIAEREGVANCMTTLKIKENSKFVGKSVCFGIDRTSGKYKIKGDTIFFYNRKWEPIDSNYYKFAVFRYTNHLKDSSRFNTELVMHQDLKDTVTLILEVIKNDISNPKNQNKEH